VREVIRLFFFVAAIRLAGYWGVLVNYILAKYFKSLIVTMYLMLDLENVSPHDWRYRSSKSGFQNRRTLNYMASGFRSISTIPCLKVSSICCADSKASSISIASEAIPEASADGSVSILSTT
jgi:hypothetical protein